MRIRLVPDKTCKRCEGRGVFSEISASGAFAEWTIRIRACACVKAVLSGKPKLSKLRAEFPEMAEEEKVDGHHG